MGVRKVNIASVALDEPLDEAGFRHVGASLGERLGARRIGAGLYQAEAGTPIWPYHYHHGIEEWLFAIAGAPVLREPAGQRTLTAGDLICFPSGHLGSHAVTGPGRFVIFATGQHLEPWMSVYPDSDKISGPGGIFLRNSAVGYWHGEGTAGSSEPVEIVREPRSSPPRPSVNLFAVGAQATDSHATRLGPLLGADRLDGTIVELAPDEGSEPYHYVYGREEWLLVLTGTLSVRHPHGEDQLQAGELLCLPEGPAGGRRLLNGGESTARALVLSTTGLPANVCYPDTGQWRVWNASGTEPVVVHETDSSVSAQSRRPC
jgi:uncharacterized cupin superfamily protein